MIELIVDVLDGNVLFHPHEPDRDVDVRELLPSVDGALEPLAGLFVVLLAPERDAGAQERLGEFFEQLVGAGIRGTGSVEVALGAVDVAYLGLVPGVLGEGRGNAFQGVEGRVILGRFDVGIDEIVEIAQRHRPLGVGGFEVLQTFVNVLESDIRETPHIQDRRFLADEAQPFVGRGDRVLELHLLHVDHRTSALDHCEIPFAKVLGAERCESVELFVQAGWILPFAAARHDPGGNRWHVLDVAGRCRTPIIGGVDGIVVVVVSVASVQGIDRHVALELIGTPDVVT